MQTVTSVRHFAVSKRSERMCLEAWTSAAAFMRQQPGFISAGIHNDVTGGSQLVEIVEWESISAFVSAAVAAERAGVEQSCPTVSAQVYGELVSARRPVAGPSGLRTVA